jgi:alanyl-tRNA synthetase
VLGGHVVQKGSLVAPDRLRFDFSHARALTEAQRQEVERLVNAAALTNRDTQSREMSLPAAKQAGAIGLFGEKYGEQVRVVTIGEESVELCGGTHVRRAGDIGLFVILSEGGIAQGVRRIEAVTGMGALDHVQRTQLVVQEAAEQLHAASATELNERLRRLFGELRARDREISELQRKLTTGGGGTDEVVEVGGIRLLAKVVDVADPKALRDAADALRDRLGSGVVVLGAERDGKATLLIAATKDLLGRVHAGQLVGVLAVHVGGRGGGRPELAQAGGPNPSGLKVAIASAAAALAEQVGV